MYSSQNATLAYMQVSIKFVSNIDEFAAEERFYSSMPAGSVTSSNLADFVPQLHATIVGSNTTWSGEHHPPAFVQERGHFSLEVSLFPTTLALKRDWTFPFPLAFCLSFFLSCFLSSFPFLFPSFLLSSFLPSSLCLFLLLSLSHLFVFDSPPFFLLLRQTGGRATAKYWVEALPVAVATLPIHSRSV